MAPATWNVHSYSGRPESSAHPDQELEQLRDGDRSKLSSMYDAGVSLFTKEAIRDLDQQLKSVPKYGQKISIKGIDGAMVDFKVLTGETHPAEPGEEYIL